MNDPNNRFPDRDLEAPFEAGYPLPEPEGDPNSTEPVGLGKLAVPHFMTFGQIVNYASRTYRWTHDEALKASHTNALAIRRDPVVMDALRTRQIPVAQLPWHIECENDQDSKQSEGVSYFTDIFNAIPRFQQLKMHLLEAEWYGRYGTQLSFGWDFSTGQKRMLVRDFKPINGDKLVFKFSGSAGILVHATFPGTWQITDRGRAHFFTPEEREQIIIHKHEPEDADFFEPELGGGVQGVGIRSRIYWLWYLRSQVTSFLMDFLERVGAGGLAIYYYEAGNLRSLNEVQAAAQVQWRNNAILMPRYRDNTTGGPGVEIVQPSTAGAQLMQALITDYFDNTIRRFILGQSQAADAAGAGLGSGISDVLEGELGRRIKYDAVNLAETLTCDLLHVLQKYSPYAACPPLRFVFDVDKPNSGELLGAAQAFYEMGGSIDEDQLRGIIGLEKPQPGHSMLAKMGAMSPAAAGAVPEGIPMMGQPGPEAGQPGMEQMPPAAAGQPPMMMRRRGERVRLARQKRGRSWNHRPYLRAIERHFAQDKSEMGRIIHGLARQGLEGDRGAVLMLGDALQESREPEWFDTVLRHGLAWPPWEGTGRGNRHKVPKLRRPVIWPALHEQYLGQGHPERYHVYEAVPWFESGAHTWRQRYGSRLHAGLTEEQVNSLRLRNPLRAERHPQYPYIVNLPQSALTPQEIALLSRPSTADIEAEVDPVEEGSIQTEPVGPGHYLISEKDARRFTGGPLPSRGRNWRVTYGGRPHWLGRTFQYGGGLRWSLRGPEHFEDNPQTEPTTGNFFPPHNNPDPPSPPAGDEPRQMSRRGSRLRFSKADFRAAVKEHFPSARRGQDVKDASDEAHGHQYTVEFPEHRVFLNYEPDNNSASLDFRFRDAPETAANVWQPRKALAPGSVEFVRQLRGFLGTLAKHGLSLEYSSDKHHGSVYRRLLSRWGWTRGKHPLDHMSGSAYALWHPPAPVKQGGPGPGESGHVPPSERSYAEQKNILLPSDLLGD